jgi:O-antigen/teichoic acid export membrane protein
VGTLALGQVGLFEDAAYFNSAFTLVTVPGTLGLIIATAVFYPDLVAMLAHGNIEAVRNVVDRSLKLSLIILAAPTAVLIVHSDFVIKLLYTNTYTSSIVPLTILAPLTAILFLQLLLIFGLYAFQRPAIAGKGMGIQFLLVFGGILLAVTPIWESHALAASVAYLFAGLGGFLAHWFDLKKILGFKMQLWRLPIVLLASTMILFLVKQLGVILFGDLTTIVSIASIVLMIPFCLAVNAFLTLESHERRRSWKLLVNLVTRLAGNDPTADGLTKLKS